MFCSHHRGCRPETVSHSDLECAKKGGMCSDRLWTAKTRELSLARTDDGLFQPQGLADAIPRLGDEDGFTSAQEGQLDTAVHFRALFESGGLGTAIVRLDDTIVSSNRVFQELLGYTAEELQAMRFPHAISARAARS